MGNIDSLVLFTLSNAKHQRKMVRTQIQLLTVKESLQSIVLPAALTKMKRNFKDKNLFSCVIRDLKKCFIYLYNTHFPFSTSLKLLITIINLFFYIQNTYNFIDSPKTNVFGHIYTQILKKCIPCWSMCMNHTSILKQEGRKAVQ